MVEQLKAVGGYVELIHYHAILMESLNWAVVGVLFLYFYSDGGQTPAGPAREWPRPLEAPWWVWIIIFLYWLALCAGDLMSPRNWREWQRATVTQPATPTGPAVGVRIRSRGVSAARIASARLFLSLLRRSPADWSRGAGKM